MEGKMIVQLATTGNASLVSWICHTLSLVLLLRAVMTSARAQGSYATDGSTALGLTAGAPAGSYALSGFDNINFYNGGLNFHLPLLQVGGRGETAFAMTLKIEQKWRVEHQHISNA